MTFTSIDIERLKVSAHNVRKSHNKTSFEELKASILAHGLMQNLVVTEADDGTYLVIAGARRLAALQALVKEGSLARGEKVPCQIVKDGEDAREMSLAENTVREAMHPADEFEAFAALAKDHKPVDIARRFGVSERHVLQRLKLGRVAPEILKDYRAEKLDLDALMAYTLTDDHKAQRKVYKAQNGHHHAYSIKRLLTENKAEGDGKLAAFVGLTAYENAGGTITSDLFGEDNYLDDSALLHHLANEKLSAHAEKLKAEGWGWIEAALESDYGLGAELFGKQWAANGGGMKKGQLVNELHNIFAKPESTHCDAKTIAKIYAWLPEGMAFTPPDKNPGKPKKKAA